MEILPYVVAGVKQAIYFFSKMSIMIDMDTRLVEWFDKQYLKWQMDQGARRKTLVKFANWLEISPATLNRWMNGSREPNNRYTEELARKLDNYEIYDILGKPRPDERLQSIIMGWGDMSENKRDYIALVEKFLSIANDQQAEELFQSLERLTEDMEQHRERFELAGNS